MREKMNECKGGCNSIMGVQKIKGKQIWALGEKARVGPLKWVGSVQPRILGRVRREYIRVLRPIFLHFFFSFSLFSPLSLGSLSSLSFFSDEKERSEVTAARWLAVLDGGAAALNVFF